MCGVPLTVTSGPGAQPEGLRSSRHTCAVMAV